MSNLAFQSVKFLRDENVKIRLEVFLKKQGIDIISKPKGLANGRLAEFSKSERRVFITNDWDFTDKARYPKEKIFSVVWLRIPQDKPELLIKAFSKLLKEKPSEKDFEGNLIILYENDFKIEYLSDPLK